VKTVWEKGRHTYHIDGVVTKGKLWRLPFGRHQMKLFVHVNDWKIMPVLVLKLERATGSMATDSNGFDCKIDLHGSKYRKLKKNVVYATIISFA